MTTRLDVLVSLLETMNRERLWSSVGSPPAPWLGEQRQPLTPYVALRNGRWSYGENLSLVEPRSLSCVEMFETAEELAAEIERGRQFQA